MRALKRRPVPNHPDCHQNFIGVFGPQEHKHRIILVWTDFPKERGWCWYYKRPNENHFVFVGFVCQLPTLRDVGQEIRVIELVASIY